MYLFSNALTKRFSILFSLLSIIGGCTAVDIYNVRGMEGEVVDGVTKQPLEGVMVIEVWEIYKPGWHGSTAGHLPLREAVSDNQGHYFFASRGTMHVEGGYLNESSPRLIFFKPGYQFSSESNRYHPDRRFEFLRKSDWDGITIELAPFEGTREQYAKELERYSGVLDNFTAESWCEWIPIPRTLSTLNDEYLKLQEAGVRASVAIGAPWVLEELRKCPASNRFFEKYKE